ncbi:hypothetical protein [Steroidobacter cummioxidans]|uniref:hypothetical protein n=1 Tax=Steroidobacter cummioxidans TaxID=1803913 RepID=UPI000E316380|nr:hypothetical protein [Steroidobacter cummioxidans]
MREFVPVARALWYLLTGVMPATMPLFLAMAFLDWYAKLLALAGFLGLIAAALAHPDREHPRVTSVIVLMLLCGVLLAGPNAYRVVQHFGESSISALDVMILAAVISAASYLVETCLAMLRPKRGTNPPNSSLEGEGTQRKIS